MSDPHGMHPPSRDESETSLCFPFDLLFTGDGVGCESGGDGETSMSFGDSVSTKLGGTVNYNLKHVN